MSGSKTQLASFAGILAIIVWSSNVAVSKTVMNEFGPFNAAFYIYFFSGIVNFIILFAALGRIKFLGYLKSLPSKYYLHTGIFFIFNNVFFYVALGLAKSNEELIIVTLLNYLWPVLIYIFRVPIYHSRINPVLYFPAIILALAGILIALLQGYSGQQLIEIAAALDDNFLAFLFAVMGAVSWALYSNLIKKYKSSDDIAAMPLIFMVSGLVFFGIQVFRGDAQSFSLSPLLSSPSLIYSILGPTCLGYLFWFLAMKHGNRNLVTSLSYLIPVGSVFLVSSIHSIPVRPMFWVSVALLTLAAIMGMKSVKD